MIEDSIREKDVLLFNKLFEKYPEDIIRASKNIEYTLKKQKRVESLINYYMRTRGKEANDCKLNEQQVNELKETWKELYNLGIIRHEWYELYLSKLGEFNPEFIGSDFHYFYTEWQKIDYDYLRGFLDKNYIDLIIKHIKQPEVIVRKIRGYYQDNGFNRISLNDAVDIIYSYADKGGAVIKISRESSGGKGLMFVDKNTTKEAIEAHLNSGRDFVVQKAIKQHSNLAIMNETSVNTIRIISMLINGESIPLSSVIRIGKEGSKVDNFSSGGVSCGINPDGSLKEVAFNSKGEKFTVHTNGFIFKNGKIPNFKYILETTKKMHYCVPMFGVVSWDIAIDESGIPVLIEYNVSQGQIDLHQYSNGPVYGKYREQIANDILNNYKKRGATLDYNYAVTKDGVAINTISNNIRKLTIPMEIEHKLVYKIEARAAQGNNKLEEIVVNAEVVEVGYIAFYRCNNLKNITFEGGFIQKIGRSAFNSCSSLEKVALSNGTKEIGTMAFRNCKQLKEIHIPDSVENIAVDAFLESPNIVIKCNKGSFAEKYAEDHAIVCEHI